MILLPAEKRARSRHTSKKADADADETMGGSSDEEDKPSTPKRNRKANQSSGKGDFLYRAPNDEMGQTIDCVFRTGPRVKVLSVWFLLISWLKGVDHYIDGQRVLLDLRQVIQAVFECSEKAANTKIGRLKALLRETQPEFLTDPSKASEDGNYEKLIVSEKGNYPNFVEFEKVKIPGRAGRGRNVMVLSQLVQLLMGMQTDFSQKLRSMVTEIAFRAMAGDHDFLADMQDNKIPDDIRLLLMSGYERTAEAQAVDPLPDAAQTFPEAQRVQDAPEVQEVKAADFLTSDQVTVLCRDKYGMTANQTHSDHFRPVRNAVSQGMSAEMLERAFNTSIRACARDKKADRAHEKDMAIVAADASLSMVRENRLALNNAAYADKEATKKIVATEKAANSSDLRKSAEAAAAGVRAMEAATAAAAATKEADLRRSAEAAAASAATKEADLRRSAEAAAAGDRAMLEHEALKEADLRKSIEAAAARQHSAQRGRDKLLALQMKAQIAEDARGTKKQPRAETRALKANMLAILEICNHGKSSEGTLRAKCSDCDQHRACYPTASVVVREVADRSYPDTVGVYCVGCSDSASRRVRNTTNLHLLPKPNNSPAERLRLVVWVRRCGLQLSGKCEACLRNVDFDGWHCAHDIASALGGSDDSVENRHVSCASCNTSSGTKAFHLVIAERLRGRVSRQRNSVEAAENVVAWIFGEKTNLSLDELPQDQRWHVDVQRGGSGRSFF